MASLFHRLRNTMSSRRVPLPATGGSNGHYDMETMRIEPDDPLLRYFAENPVVVEVDRIELQSPGLNRLKEAGVHLVAPLVSQGELVGLLHLGPRLSEQDYSPDDFRLLNSLITQAAPALRVAQMAETQKAEALRTERLDQELRVARLIQQTLLPKQLPDIPGWQVSTFYRPARAVGGDFYDFLYFPDGRIGFVIGDVTDKGMPAALLMATTRATLRAAALRMIYPGEVLRQTNETLYPDVPPSMFVTCLYALLDPATGKLIYANAGHNLPYRRDNVGISELHATGMPLGLLPGMEYEEYETEMIVGESLLMYSDGLVEAHSPQRELFGNPRLESIIYHHHGGDPALIEDLLAQLFHFTGPGWEQEDDITIVALHRDAGLGEG